MNDELILLAINLTRRCNLGCAHCYLDAKTLEYGSEDELGTAEVQQLLDQVAGRSPDTMVVLTGGEPLARPDLEAIAAHGAGLGLSMVVGTNGSLLTKRRVASLKQAGVIGVGISVDSLTPNRHDAFRGRPGTWARTMRGIEQCREQGLSFQIHFSVTEENAHEFPAMVEFARSAGARVLNVFFLICTGRGESVSNITPSTYEHFIEKLIEAQERSTDLIIRARCAPYFKRIAHQRDPQSALNRISGQEGDGCIAGTHYCRITPEGNVTACPYIETSVGSIRNQDFVEIWEQAEDFQRLRAPQLEGKCGRCEYRKLCGGCRARPVAEGRDLMAADNWCTYQPRGQAVIVPLTDFDIPAVRWTPEARQRLSRIPGFLRKMVRKRAEAYVTELGDKQVTTEHLAELYARRFGSNGPGERPAS